MTIAELIELQPGQHVHCVADGRPFIGEVVTSRVVEDGTVEVTDLDDGEQKTIQTEDIWELN